MKKKTTLVLGIVVAVLLFSVFHSFSPKNERTIVTIKEKPEELRLEKEIVSNIPYNNDGVFFYGEDAWYENLPQEAKKVVEEFYNTKDLDASYSYLKSNQEEKFFNQCLLKYYDSEVVMIGCLSAKGVSVYIFNRHTWEFVPGEGMSFGDSYWEGDGLLLYVGSNRVIYFKEGDRSIRVLDGSEISSKTEAYEKFTGIPYLYDFIVSTSTRTIILSVFSTESASREKTREIIISLP